MFGGLADPVPAEPAPLTPGKSRLEAIYDADLAAGETSFWIDRLLERPFLSTQDSSLYTRGRALYMYTHTAGTLGFAGGYAYRERPTGANQSLFTVAISGATLSEVTAQRRQYPSHWASTHTATGLSVSQRKFITYNNTAVSVISITNTGTDPTTRTITASSPIATMAAQLGTELTGSVKARGGLTAQAYATRYPRHLRSVILNGPVAQLEDVDMLDAAGSAVRRITERVGEICARSRDCGRSKAESVAAVSHLLDVVRRRPVTGRFGGHDVRIDATYVLVHIIDSQSFLLTNLGDLPAAVDALDRGDSAPLLRLAAEGEFDVTGDNGDPAFYSQGANAATSCVDLPKPWSPFAPLALRQAQYASAVAHADDRAFAPFRAEGIMFSEFGGSETCLPWPQTGIKPAVAPGARYPDVPTLVLNGEFDLGAVIVRRAAQLWPDARVVDFKGTVHRTFDGGALSADLQVDGPLDGTLHLDGGWFIPGAPRTVLVSGKLGGRTVAAEVPSG